MNDFPLAKVTPGTKVRVTRLEATGLTRRRLLDLGLIPGTEVEAIRKSPLGDPIAYAIRGAVIALRQEESSQVYVEAA